MSTEATTTETADPTQICEFIQTLYDIISNPRHTSIEWAPDGEEVIINSEQQFTNEVLLKYFRASSFASFVRQLNLYGFSKRGGRFSNAHFRRDYPEELYMVRRRGVGGVVPAISKKKATKKKDEKEHAHGSRQSSRIQQLNANHQYQDGSSDYYSDDGDGDDGDQRYDMDHHNNSNQIITTHHHNPPPPATTTTTTTTTAPQKTKPTTTTRQPNKPTPTIPKSTKTTTTITTTTHHDDSDDSDGFPFPDEDDYDDDADVINIPLDTMNDDNSNVIFYPLDIPPTSHPQIPPYSQYPTTLNTAMTNHPLIPFPPRSGTQTILPHHNGPQTVPLEHFNAAVGALEDQVDLIVSVPVACFAVIITVFQ